MNYIEVSLGKGVSDTRKVLTKEIAEWCLGQLLPKAVSYTHLTLPTSDLV